MKQASHPQQSIPQNDTIYLVQSFLQDCKYRGLSPETIRSYNDFLSKFAKALSELPNKPEPIVEFIGSFHSSDERRHACYRVLRTFYGFLDNRFDLITNPIHKIKPPRRLPKEAKALTLEELKNLLEYPGHNNLIKTLLHLLADTGIRIGEVPNIKREDIGTDNTLRITRGKTGQRIVPVSPETRYMLLQLKAASDDKLFPCKAHWYSELMIRAFKKAGIKGSAHTLRHTFATLFRGSDQSLMTITGHRSYSMILNYSHRREERAAEEHSHSGPLARLYGPTQQPAANNDLVIKIAELAQELGAAKERIKYLESCLNMNPAQLTRQN